MIHGEFRTDDVVAVTKGARTLDDYDLDEGTVVILCNYDDSDNSWSVTYQDGRTHPNGYQTFWLSERFLAAPVSTEEVQAAIESIKLSASGKTIKHCPTCTCGERKEPTP